MKAGQQGELFSLPPVTRPCARCGAAVAALTGQPGRPIRFCSDECRKAQADDQRHAWLAGHKAQDRPSSLICEACDGSFAVPAIGRGRYPAFCSPECRGVGHRKRAAGYRLKRAKIKTVPQGGEVQKSETGPDLDRRGNKNLSGASFPKSFFLGGGDG